MSLLRTRWAAIGAAVAVTLGAGGLGLVHATNPSGASAYQPINPCRLVALRAAPDTVGTLGTSLGDDVSVTVDGWGAHGDCTGPLALPSGTTGLALNVTALNPTERTNLRLHPSDIPVPGTSNLNPVPGEPPAPNAVDVKLDASGRFDIYNFQGDVEVIVDVVGVYRDHDHDDRYYTEGEIDAMAPMLASGTQGNTAISDTGSGAVVATATVAANAPGTIVASGAATISESDGDAVGCGLFEDGETFTLARLQQFQPDDDGVTDINLKGVVAAVQHFQVLEAGAQTIEFRCLVTSTIGDGNSTSARGQLSLVFYPG